MSRALHRSVGPDGGFVYSRLPPDVTPYSELKEAFDNYCGSVPVGKVFRDFDATKHMAEAEDRRFLGEADIQRLHDLRRRIRHIEDGNKACIAQNFGISHITIARMEELKQEQRRLEAKMKGSEYPEASDPLYQRTPPPTTQGGLEAITPCGNGWMVKVGCQTLVFQRKDIQKLLWCIARYLLKPEKARQEYESGSLNSHEILKNLGMFTPEGIDLFGADKDE